MDRRTLYTSLIAATLFAGGSTFAQQQTPADTGGQLGLTGQAGQTGQQTMASEADKLFIKNAAMGNMCEMKLAQAAQDKAQSPEVKKLAQQIIQDHQMLDQHLKEVAQKTGADLPQDLPQGMQKDIDTLTQLQGKDFDQQFVSAVKAGHSAAISRFADEAKIAKSQDVKQFAAQQLPTLQRHGDMVMSCAMAEGLSTESLGQAQPAGATITPSQDQHGQQQQQRPDSQQRDSSFTPDISQQRQQQQPQQPDISR